MTRVRGVPVDYTNIGYEALRESMLEIARRTLPEWNDHSENDLGVLILELSAYAADITMYYQSRIAAQLFPSTSDEPGALVQLLRLLGHELRPPTPATVDLEISVDSATPLPLAIPARTVFRAEGRDGPVQFETPHDVNLSSADLGPLEDGKIFRFYPLSAVEGRSVVAEPVGRGDGSPAQIFRLAQSPVIPDSLSVEVIEPGGRTVWREVPDFARSGPTDRVFVTRREADGVTSLLFGDGSNGRTVPAGTSTSPVDVLASYRVGGGPQGNVPAGTVLTSDLQAVKSAVAPHGGTGGAPGEDAERARTLAPRLYRGQNRAVTAQDYVDLALRTPGVGKAIATPDGWNGVRLTIAPSGRVGEPGELLVRDLLAAFESTRMLTTSLTVVGPVAVPVYITADVQAQPYFLAQEVQTAVEAAVSALLAFDAVDFGTPVYLSRVYDAVQSLPQVLSLNITQFSRHADGTVDSNGVVALRPDEIAVPGYAPGLQATVTGAVPDG